MVQPQIWLVLCVLFSPSTINMPGAREGATGWYDSINKELWLFGGNGYGSNNSGALVWCISTTTDNVLNCQTGSNITDQVGVYSRSEQSSITFPGGRHNAVGWYDSSTQEFRIFGGQGYGATKTSGYLNDVWMVSWKCLPLHQEINNTCVSLLECPPDNESNCTLRCDLAVANTSTSLEEEEICSIQGDMIVEGDFEIITIPSVINVTGDVTVSGDVTVILSPGATLHVGKCLLVHEKSQIIVVLNGVSSNSVLATYDPACSSQQLADRVKIESPFVDVCRDGKPTVFQRQEEDGRATLELVFVPMSDSSECRSVNVVAISVAVPLAVLFVVVIVVVMAVPKIRAKVFPFAKRRT